jgi:hypothetical protein
MFFVAAQAFGCKQAYIRIEYNLKDWPSISLDVAKATVENVVNSQLNYWCVDSMDKPVFDPCWYSQDESANTIVCPFRLFRVSKGCDLEYQLNTAFRAYQNGWLIIEIQLVGDVHCGSREQ